MTVIFKDGQKYEILDSEISCCGMWVNIVSGYIGIIPSNCRILNKYWRLRLLPYVAMTAFGIGESVNHESLNFYLPNQYLRGKYIIQMSPDLI